VPAAIHGTERLFVGPLPKPRRVQIAFGEPIEVIEEEPSPAAAHELISQELWPQVQRQFGRLRARKSLIAASLAAVGLGAGVAAHQRKRRRVAAARVSRTRRAVARLPRPRGKR
jgi:1-acyl-sn-glycerol-3-phosphate acyltransferase